MNYPLWSLPAPGLLIACVAILHVFISHFAVGGGLFLVLAERKARREHDDEMLGYVRRHSAFFALLTLVLGAVTGVGIWFTIGLVHPQATSSLILIFVWAWAIEWTFFVVEIAAAMVYYYGWDRLDAATHQLVGWIYFAAAWLSLVVINGILTFMLTPGAWLQTGNMWDGLLNPTYWPSLLARTFTAVGLAGLYVMLTAAGLANRDLKVKVTRYAAKWILPMTVALPLAVVWFLWAASHAGVQVLEVLGLKAASVSDIIAVLTSGSASGYPPAIIAARTVIVASMATLLLTLANAYVQPRAYGRAAALVLLATAMAAMGGGEWVREDLRKPVRHRALHVRQRGSPRAGMDARGCGRRAGRARRPVRVVRAARGRCSQVRVVDAAPGRDGAGQSAAARGGRRPRGVPPVVHDVPHGRRRPGHPPAGGGPKPGSHLVGPRATDDCRPAAGKRQRVVDVERPADAAVPGH